ncbi:MAG: S24/S26 family peptidase [Clostridia bacterium]|nr:S24/S26 family peptidase [Clostridia bacterium]
MPSDFERAAEELLFTEELSFLTRGRSMRPLFREHRDIINIKTVTEPLKKGDVVLYPDNGGINLVLHRIIKVNGDDLIIRGDNNYFREYRKADEMVGIMSSFYREGIFCDVKKSKKYKLYTFWILNSYYIRAVWVTFFLPAIKKIIRIFKHT